MLEHWPKACKFASQICCYPFVTLGPIQGYNAQHLLITLGRLKIFFLFQPWFLV
jgi:hypothetical protein